MFLKGVMVRVAIYAHVPAREGAPAAEEQIAAMRAAAARDGWEVVRTYCDTVPLAQAFRPEHEQMLADAQDHLFDALLFWNLESLSPHNASRTLALLDRLSSESIRFCSYSEPALDSCHLLREAVVSLVALFLQQDRVYIARRTLAGLEQQRQTQKPGPAGRVAPGRPPVDFDRAKAEQLRGRASYQQIAQSCGVSKATIARYFKKQGPKNRE